MPMQRLTSMTEPSMSTRGLVAWTGAVFLIAIVARMAGAAAAAPAPLPPIDALTTIAWGCIALLLHSDAPSRPAAASQAWALLLAASSCLLAGPMLYVGMTAAGLWLAMARGWSSRERRIGLILVALATNAVWAKLVLMLCSSVLLSADTALAGLLLRLFVPGSSWHGIQLTPPHDLGITVGAGCSSFVNLSYVSLCYVSFAALDGARNWCRNLIAVAGVALMIIAINTVRLLLMARASAQFAYWHAGSGAQWFGVGTSLAVVVLCSLASSWARR